MAVDLSFGGTAFPRAYEVRELLYRNSVMGTSSRYRTLDRLDAFYKCLEYAHQSIDWNGHPADAAEAISPAAVVPYGMVQPDHTGGGPGSVRKKRPTAPLRLTPLVVDRFTGLLFGKDRTPKVTIEGDDAADDFVQAVFKKALFWRTMYQARTQGGAMGSTLVTVHLRADKYAGKGRFSFRAHSPKTVQDIVWDDPDLKIPAGVLIQYIFFKEIEILEDDSGAPAGRTKRVPYLYRRIIDEEMDIVFKPAEIQGSELPDLQVDTFASYRHGLGRFPGVWIQNLPNDDDIDGFPDCDGAFQMFEAIDRQVAQADKALLANQDPTLVLSRDKKLDQANVPLRKGSENALNVGVGGTAQYLEISGAGITASQAFVKDMKTAAMDKVQCVLVDPEKVSGAAQSAKAIEYLYGPMLEKAGRLREQYGQGIERMAELVLDIARLWADPLKYPGRAVPQFDLPPRTVESDADPSNPDSEPARMALVRNPGKPGTVSLKWGSYFAPTPDDIQKAATTIASVVQAQLMDRETAIKLIAPLFSIEDVQALIRKVKEEVEEAEAKQLEMMGAGFGGMDGGGELLPPDDQPGGPPGGPPAQPPMDGGPPPP